jgi:DNA-directed RNA polymerase subunit RPC12/RpoP
MGRTCASCGYSCSRGEFSANQWSKGEGYSRCRDCVEGNGVPTAVYECEECQRTFNSSNELNMHRQVHRPRNVSCPLCGLRNFRSGANAVQHVESGYCTGCIGQDNARQRIYEFASTRQEMRSMLSNAPMIQDGYNSGQRAVPNNPYQCNCCGRQFHALSQLMQHQDQKHNINNTLRIGY